MSTLLSSPVLVLAEHQHDGAGQWTLVPSSAQAISCARSLSGAGVVAVSLVGEPDRQALGELGVDTILCPKVVDHAPRVSALVADAIAACLKGRDFSAFLLASSYRGREVGARIATLTGSGIVAEASALDVEDPFLIATTVSLAGTWTNRTKVGGVLPTVTLKSGAFTITPAPSVTDPVIERLEVKLSPEAAAIEVVSSTVEEGSGRVSLADAQTVVVAGAGTRGDLSPVEALADELDAALGATRVVCDEGWAARSVQIGQTGMSISPNLYIGLGVSGAIHHTVGMQSSAHIVAVCDDPDAPIFEIADFGVVGDLFEVIPQTIEALRAAHA